METRTTADDHFLPCLYAPLLPVPRLRHLYTNRSWLRHRVFIGGGKDDLLGVGVDHYGEVGSSKHRGCEVGLRRGVACRNNTGMTSVKFRLAE